MIWGFTPTQQRENRLSRYTIALEGTNLLVNHNARLANPDDPIAKAIKAITTKRVKTEEDRQEIAKLEWHGGLYTAPTILGPVLPTGNIRKCLVQGAKVRKQGAQLGRALFFGDLYTPIIYDGPRDIEQLWLKEEFRYYVSVGVQQARTMRMRPCFPGWRLETAVELLDDVMDPDDLQRIVDLAGLMEGLGENRINGYGRFTGKVVAA